MEFRSRAVRSLVELHERELPLFLESWERFAQSTAPMPEAHGDAAYESREHLVAHALRCARGYLTWIGECLGRPVTEIDSESDVQRIASRRREFAFEILRAWRRHLTAVTDTELSPATHRTRWGEQFSIETMLEHAVVHPMRHRIQLERILKDHIPRA